MSRGGRYPRITCPGCGRQNVSVAPSAETVTPHDRPAGSRCDTSGQQVDLYGPELAGGQS